MNKPAEVSDEGWAALMNATVVFWVCSQNHKNVAWTTNEDKTMTPHCLDCDEVGDPR